ncbi:unnamed protein product [Gongylonema pulchrum]|uniref:Uncharacterized protein n=1 Tax=Gongylonema pulchrum TaxID=637853 RepID=A0A183DRH4_9BILA|nr:unnamed protein product [Gongylonema pulchrum]
MVYSISSALGQLVGFHKVAGSEYEGGGEPDLKLFWRRFPDRRLLNELLANGAGPSGPRLLGWGSFGRNPSLLGGGTFGLYGS